MTNVRSRHARCVTIPARSRHVTLSRYRYVSVLTHGSTTQRLSMHMQTPHSSQHITVGTHAKVAISSRRHRWCKHSLARARIGVPSSVRGCIKVASTTVHRSFNGNARLRSRTKLLGNLAAAPDWRAHSNSLAHRESESEARLTLERVGRFERALFGRTHATRVRAAVQEAADGEAAFGGEACPEQILCERKWSLQKSSYTTP